MADAQRSYVRYTGDGAETTFALSFAGENIGYIRASHIRGFVDDVEVPISIDPNSPHLVEFETAPAEGSSILIRRDSNLDSPYATFGRGNDFTYQNVNNSFLQQLYLNQEAADGFLPESFELQQNTNAGGRNIYNLADGTEDDHAVNKGQLDQSASDIRDELQDYKDQQAIRDQGQDNALSNYKNEQAQTDAIQDGRILDLEQSLTEGELIYRRVTFTATEGQEVFNLTSTTLGILALYINGLNQIAGEAYELVGDSAIRTLPLEEGDRVVAVIGQEPQYLEPEQVDLRYYREVFFAQEGQASYLSPYDFVSVFGVYINGVRQSPEYAYTFDSEFNSVTFAEGLEGGDEVLLLLGQEPEESLLPNLSLSKMDRTEALLQFVASETTLSKLKLKCESLIDSNKITDESVVMSIEYDSGTGGGNQYFIRKASSNASRPVSDLGSIIHLDTNEEGYYLEGVFPFGVNVRQFGAVGDGVSDDTDSCQEALNFSNNVLFPVGLFGITRKLEKYSSLSRVYGVSKHLSTILPLSSFDRDTYDCLLEVGTPSTNNYIVEDIEVSAAYGSSGNDLSGLAINAGYNVDINDCKLKSGNYVTRENGGLLIRSGKHTRINGSNLHNGYCYGVVVMTHSNGLHFNSCAFDECSVNIISKGNILEIFINDNEFGQAVFNDFFPTPTEKVQIDLSVGAHGKVSLSGNILSGGTNTKYGLIVANVEQLLVDGNIIAGNTRFGIVHNGSKDTVITDNMFANNGSESTVTDPSLGTRDYENTPYCSDIYKYSAFLQPTTIVGNTTDITDRPMAWIEGTGSSLANSLATIVGNSCSGGAAYIHGTLVNDNYFLISGRLFTSVTRPVEVTIPSNSFNAGQVHYGNLSVSGVSVGDVIVMSPKTSSELTAGLMYNASVNASGQVRWTIVNATTGVINEPSRTFVLSIIKN